MQSFPSSESRNSVSKEIYCIYDKYTDKYVSSKTYNQYFSLIGFYIVCHSITILDTSSGLQMGVFVF